MVLCEDPNELAWGDVACQQSYFLSQSLGKHERATKPALEHGEEEARGLWGSGGICSPIPAARAPLPGRPCGHSTEPRGGGRTLICSSAGSQSTSSGKEVLLCWHPLEIKGSWWKRAGLRQPNLHACFIMFASIDVKMGKVKKKPNQCRLIALAMHSATPPLASKDLPGLRSCSSFLERAAWTGGWRSPGQRRFSSFLPQRKDISVPFSSQHVGGMLWGSKSLIPF